MRQKKYWLDVSIYLYKKRNVFVIHSVNISYYYNRTAVGFLPLSDTTHVLTTIC